MKVEYRISVLGTQVAQGEEELSNYSASFDLFMGKLRKEYGNWATIVVTFLPI